jgi:hypothetical protein
MGPQRPDGHCLEGPQAQAPACTGACTGGAGLAAAAVPRPRASALARTWPPQRSREVVAHTSAFQAHSGLMAQHSTTTCRERRGAGGRGAREGCA